MRPRSNLFVVVVFIAGVLVFAALAARNWVVVAVMAALVTVVYLLWSGPRLRSSHPDYGFRLVREDREVGHIECRYRGAPWLSINYQHGPGKTLRVGLSSGIGPVPQADREAFVAALRDSLREYEVELY
jgi:hypothetical protein